MSRKDFKPGAILRGKYEILDLLGTGGMGRVVKAKRIEDGAVVAIKYCFSRDEEQLRRFAREVRVMQSLTHPHVIPVLKRGLNFDPPYFVMPLATGSIRSELEELKAEEQAVLNGFLEFCDGIQAIHAAGAVHRDIKPDNALRIEGRVVVSDLGLAKFEHRDSTILTKSLAVVGTEGYLAPEQRARGGSRDADKRTDIFQLGKMLYEMLTNSDPTLMDFSSMAPGLAQIIRRATRDLPAERYQSVGEVIDAIKIYQLAKEPGSNPLAVFETTLAAINEKLRRHEYREKDVRTLLAVFSIPDVQRDSSQYLDLFDRIPEALLRICAEEFAEELLPVMEAYVEAIDASVGGKSFGYAEDVASKMDKIFSVPADTGRMKALTLEAVLISATRLNRFAAMDEFSRMLPEIQDEDEAFEVAEMLRRRKHAYRGIYHQVPAIKLHPTIRQVRDEFELKVPSIEE
jgi:eukaryotic-like serine/threonine-protein kinase